METREQQSHTAAHNNANMRMASIENRLIGENAKLREQLVDAQTRLPGQEPIYQVRLANGSTNSAWIDVSEAEYNSAGIYQDDYVVRKVYAAPIPPADVQELRIANDELHVAKDNLIREQKENIDTAVRVIEKQQERIAELERKLAGQHAVLKLAEEAFERTASEFRTGYLKGGSVLVSDMRVEAWKALSNCGREELNTLLAQAQEEGRKEAVPDGWHVVPVNPTSEMMLAGERERLSHVGNINPRPTWSAMLAAAPKPEVKP